MNGEGLPASRAEWRLACIAVAAIVTVYAAFHLALVWRFPPFYDEAAYARFAFEAFRDPDLRFVSMRVGDEPLFTWLGAGLVWLGAAPFAAVRLSSTLSGLVTLVLCGLIGRELGGWRVGLASAGLAAILPFFVVLNVIGKTDSLATALVTAALFLQIRLARRPSLAGAILLGLTLGAGVLTKPTTYVAIALIPFSLLVFDWSPADRGRRIARWVGCVALALALSYTLYSILKLSPFWEAFGRQSSERGSQHSLGAALDTPGKWIELNWPVYRSTLAGYLTIPVIIAATVGFGLGLRRSPRLAGLIGIWLLVPLLIVLLLTEIQYPRYVLAGMPPVVVLAAYGSVCVLDWVRSRGWRGRPTIAALAAIAAVLVLPALIFDARVLAAPATAHYPGLDDWQYVTGGAALKPYEAIARDLRTRGGHRGLVVALGDFTSDFWQVDFRDEPNVQFIRIDAPDICPALFAVETQAPLPRRTDGLAWAREQVYPRPRGGTPTTLYRSGVVVGSAFAASPDELHRAIGGSDRYFDAFVNGRPCLKAWLASWYQTNGGA